MSLVFPFDPNIERASTIPARVYNDPVFLELERERIFARTWQLVGRVDDVREHGQFITAQIENDPIVVLRDGDTLRGFYNVCLHRAGPVASGCGKRNTLQCKYHGWTYSLDGTLRRAPEMQGVQRFDPESMHLVPVQVATWGPLVFVNVDGKAPPLADVLEDLPTRLAPFRCESMRYVMRKEWEIACNWKIYVDNFLEGYHLPFVHPGLSKVLDYGLDMQTAMDLPRLFPRPGTQLVEAEGTLPAHTREALTRRGYEIVAPNWAIGGAQAIQIDWENGALIGASDHRKDGCALGI